MIAPSPQQQQPNQQTTVQSLAQQPTPQADLERQRAMRDAWKSYRGEFGDPLKVGRDQLNDNVISNRCAPVVDKGVSFLFGQPLKIEASDETPTGSSDIQDYIDGLWGDDDDKMSLLSKLAMNGGVCGQAFMKLIPPQGQMKYPRLVTLDPQIVRIVTPPDDCDLIQAFIIEYPGPNDMQCKQIIARVDPDNLAGIAGEYDLDDSWQIANFQRKNKNIGGINAQWEQVGETQTWPYPFPPIFTCQNLPNPNESWGIPDLTQDLIRQNRVLNFIQSNTARIIKYHAHPKTWAKGIGSTQIQMAVDDLTILQSDSAQLQNLEMSSDLSSSLNFAATIRSDMDEQSRVPAVALGRQADLPKGNISGVALALMFQPLIEKTTMKRRSYGAMIRQLTRAALIIAGLIDIADYENYAVDIHWSSLLPNDDLQAAQTALILQQLGASTSTLLSGLGLDPENEAQKVEKEQARQVQNYSRGVGLPPAQPQLPGTAPTEATVQPQQQQGGQ
jgi:hypothetical protein